MAENPYAAPDAHAHDAQPAAPLAKAPDTILRKIMVGWIVASLSAAIDLFWALRAFTSGNIPVGVGISIDAVILGAGAYGLYRKSRVAALLLLGYYVLGRVLMLIGGNVSGMVLGVIIVFIYVAAAKGTFDHHRWLLQERRSPSSLRPRLSDDPLFRTPAAAPAAPQPDTAPATDSAPAATPPA
jgi:hypothetical protein